MNSETDAGRSRIMQQALILLAVAFVSRCIVFGNPIIHVDEEYYLLVGNRMLDGLIPYVDTWDRKPIGLFLIYAAFGWLGGGGVLAYQVGAALTATATALVICRIASRVAPPTAALTAGIVYLLYLLTFNGVGGQSPVFYNLLVVLAAVSVMAVLQASTSRRVVLLALGAMLLMGLAIQIKYSVIFEGMFFGLAILWHAWRRLGWSLISVVALGAVMIGVALLPTVAALAAYWAIGQSDAFLDANFLAIFGRRDDRLAALARLVLTAALLSPFAWPILRGRAEARALPANPVLHFVQIWVLVAIGGYLIFGAYYDHYAIPMLVPLSILAASGLSWVAGRRGPAMVLVGAAAVSGVAIVTIYLLAQGNRSDLDRMTAMVRPHLAGGCLFIYEGDMALYGATDACWPTRFNFPTYLNNVKETDSLPVAPDDEVRRVLATRPSVVVMAEQPRRTSNLSTREIMLAGMQRAYREVGRTNLGQRGFVIYALANPAR